MQHYVEVINPTGRLTPLGPFASLDEANAAKEEASKSKVFEVYLIGEVYEK